MALLVREHTTHNTRAHNRFVTSHGWSKSFQTFTVLRVCTHILSKSKCQTGYPEAWFWARNSIFLMLSSTWKSNTSWRRSSPSQWLKQMISTFSSSTSSRYFCFGRRFRCRCSIWRRNLSQKWEGSWSGARPKRPLRSFSKRTSSTLGSLQTSEWFTMARPVKKQWRNSVFDCCSM